MASTTIAILIGESMNGYQTIGSSRMAGTSFFPLLILSCAGTGLVLAS